MSTLRPGMAEAKPPPARQTECPPAPTHGADGRFISTLEVAERDAQAARLWSQGKSHRQIARELGYSSHRGAAGAVERGLTASRRLDVEAREAALLRLAVIRQTAAAMEAEARKILAETHLATNNAGVIVWDGAPLEDSGPKLAAIDRVLAAVRMTLAADEREAKLLGLDAETKVNLTGGVRYELVGVDPADVVGGRLLEVRP